MAVTIKGFASDWSVPEPAKQSLSGTFATLDANGNQPVRRGDYEVSATEFGLKGDGTDETVKFQAFVDHLTANRKTGILPAKEYRISAPIDIRGTLGNLEGWGLRGGGMASTTILQTTDNTPIFRVGVGLEESGAYGCRMWSITDMTLRYQNNQPATNTNAIPILFVGMCYQFELRRLFFYNGFYGQKTVANQVVPWGSTWDDLYFNKLLTGGAIDWTGVNNDGPNNRFGRIFVEAEQMAGPIFIVQGHNTRWDIVEIIGALLGPQLFLIKSKSRFSIGAIKVENARYYSARVLLEIQTQAHVEIDQFRVYSLLNEIAPASGEVYAARLGSGGNLSYLRVGHLELGGGTNTSAFAFTGTRDNRVVVDNPQITDGWKLTKVSISQTAEMVKIDRYSNGIISINQGDISKTVVLGDPTTLYFETPLTAARTVTLPSDADSLTGALTYEIVSAGAVNGANTLAIMSGARLITTITADNYRVVLAWRRHATGANGWTVRSAGPTVVAPTTA